MKTTTIEIRGYKDTSLNEAVWDLFGHTTIEGEDEDEHADRIGEKGSDIFEYGEFMDATIIVDENLNIIGGKIIPHKP